MKYKKEKRLTSGEGTVVRVNITRAHFSTDEARCRLSGHNFKKKKKNEETTSEIGSLRKGVQQR